MDPATYDTYQSHPEPPGEFEPSSLQSTSTHASLNYQSQPPSQTDGWSVPMERCHALNVDWTVPPISTRQQLPPVCLPAEAVPANPAYMPPSQAHLFAKVLSPEGLQPACEANDAQQQDSSVHDHPWIATQGHDAAPDTAGHSPPLRSLVVSIQPEKSAGSGAVESDSCPITGTAVYAQTPASGAAFPSHPDEPRTQACRSMPRQAAKATEEERTRPSWCPTPAVAPSPAPHAALGSPTETSIIRVEPSSRAPCAASWVTLQGARACAHCSSSFVAFGLPAGAGGSAGERQGWRGLFCATCLRGELDTRCSRNRCRRLTPSPVPLILAVA